MARAPLIDKRSRLQFAIFLPDFNGDQNGFDFFDLLDLPDIPPQPDDLKYIVRGEDRIDLLADKFYGNAVLWWVIALANDLEILPIELEEGVELLIPAPRFVQNELFKIPPKRA